MATPPPQASFLATRQGKLTLALLCAVGFLDFVDASIVNVALPSIRHRPPLLRAEPAVGAQRLPAHLRRVHAARRPRGRSDRSPAVARRRHVGICALLTRRWARRQRRDARRRPTHPGDRGGDDDPGGTLDPHDVVSRGQRPQHGARRMGRAGRAGVRGRRVSRRRALRGSGVAVGVLRKPPRLRC